PKRSIKDSQTGRFWTIFAPSAGPGFSNRTCCRESGRNPVAMPSLSQVVGPPGPPLLEQTIGDNLRRTVERHAQREAVVIRHQGIRVDYRQFWDDVGRAARALLGLGIAAGDRVGVWSANRYEWVVVQYATARIGAILVNINPAYLQEELAYALRQSEVSVLFLASRVKQTEYVPLLDAAGR